MSYIIFILLLIIVAGFIFYPLISKKMDKGVANESVVSSEISSESNLKIHREALSNLELSFKVGELSEAEFETQKLELQRRFLDDTSAENHAVLPVSNKQSSVFILALAFVVLGVSAFLLYQNLGSFEETEITRLSDAFYDREPGAEINLPQAKELITKLETYVDKNPRDLPFIYLLAVTSIQAKDFDKGVAAYKQYLMILPTDERVLTEYVQILYMSVDYQLTERVEFVVGRALMLNPNNTDVLGMMAMHHFKAAEFTEAITYWQRMLKAVSMSEGADSETVAIIQSAIEKAQQELQLQAGKKEPVDKTREKVRDKSVDKPVKKIPPNKCVKYAF